MSRPSREHRLVTVLLRATQAALRVRRAESAGEAAREEADAALELAFAPIWERLSHVELLVTPDAIEFDGLVVLTGEADGEGLIPSLAHSGICSLTLIPGVEREEIKLVMTAITAAGAGAGERATELLTSLFRADLHHVQYVVGDLSGGEPASSTSSEPQVGAARPSPITSPQPHLARTPDVIRDTVRRDAGASTTGIVHLEHFDSTLYFLDDREIEYLKSSVDREYAQDLAVNALSLLLEIVELRTEPAVRDEVIGVLADLLPDLLSSGRFEAVAYLISGVREASRNAAELTELQKEALDQLRASISQPSATFQLFQALEAGAIEPTPQSMEVLLRELRPAAIRQVLRWSHQLSDAGRRDAVVAALDSFFTTWPHSLVRMLTAPERDVVQAGLELAGRLRHPEFVETVAEVISHPDPVVRRLVAETLASFGTAASLRRLTGLAHDPSGDVRLVVYRTFAARPYRGAFSALQGAITSDDLEQRGQREKRALFQAFGAVAGADGISILSSLLRGKSRSGPRPSSHTRACAAIALGLIATPHARSALNQAARDRDPVVRSAVSSALRGEG